LALFSMEIKKGWVKSLQDSGAGTLAFPVAADVEAR